MAILLSSLFPSNVCDTQFTRFSIKRIQDRNRSSCCCYIISRRNDKAFMSRIRGNVLLSRRPLLVFVRKEKDPLHDSIHPTLIMKPHQRIAWNLHKEVSLTVSCSSLHVLLEKKEWHGAKSSFTPSLFPSLEMTTKREQGSAALDLEYEYSITRVRLKEEIELKSEKTSVRNKCLHFSWYKSVNS